MIVTGKPIDFTIKGSGFTPDAVVLWSDKPHPITFHSGVEIVVHLDASDVGVPGKASLVIRQSDVSGGSFESAPAEITITNDISHTAVTASDPKSLNAGNSNQQITLTGTGFTSNSKVLVNNVEQATQFVDPANLKVTIPGTMLSSPTPLSIAIVTPISGGGRRISAPLSVQVNPPPVDVTINLPSSFPLQPHVALSTAGITTKGSCGSNRSASQEAKIWGVQLRFDTPQLQGATAVSGPIPMYMISTDSNSFFLPHYSFNAITVKVSNGPQTFDGQLKANLLGLPVLDFYDLDFAQAGQLLSALRDAGTQSQIVRALASAHLVVEVLRLEVPSDKNSAISTSLIPAYIRAILAGDNTQEDPATILETILKGGYVDVPGLLGTRLYVSSTRSKAKPIDAGSFSINTGNLQAEMDDLTHFQAEGDAGTAKLTLIVDQPCLQFSAAPVITNQSVRPAVTFKYRYDYFDSQIRNYLKLRAEGQTSDSAINYFQRGEAHVDLGRNLNFAINTGKQGVSPKTPNTLLSTSLSGTFSFGGNAFTTVATPMSPQSGSLPYEWRYGGRFQVLLPFISNLHLLPSSQSRPMITVDANGVSSKIFGQPSGTDFLTIGSFAYSAAVQTRLTLDLNGNAGWSNSQRFAGHSSYGYLRMQGRFNLTSNYDFLVRYECGRQSPDYRKFCGWQTGFAVVTR